MKKFYFTLLTVGIVFCAKAQDSQYTQFYAAQTSLNPAFAGTSIENRLMLNYRNQWAGVNNAFVNYSFSYDKYLPKLSSGVALLASREQAGAGHLTNSSVGVQYAYEARINRDVFFRPAMQFSYISKSIDFGNLLFTDQMIRDGDPATLETNITAPISYFDFSTGILFNSTKWWAGFSIHHLTEPDEALYQYSQSILPKKYSAHAGYKINLKDKFGAGTRNYAVFAANWKKQGEFDQLDLGMYFELDPLVMGVWYRNLPFKSNGFDKINHDAIAFIVGYQMMKFKIGYSYDITVSQLSVGSTAGSHEISVSFEWADKKNKKLAKRRIIPCAKF